MFKSSVKAAFRNLLRRKTYSILIVMGLGVAMACAMLIMAWVRHELGYDRYHANAAELYRVVGDDAIMKKIAVTCGPLAATLKTEFPGVVNAARYMPYAGSPFRYKEKILQEEKGAFADPAFLDMFSFRFLGGIPGGSLSHLSDIVITEGMAKRFFGDDNPLGKTLLVDGKSPVIVSAVIEDPPSDSQLQFSFLMNMQVLKLIGFPFDEWSNAGLYTFIQVEKHADIQALNAQIADVMPKHIPGFARKLFLQPLTDMHLSPGYMGDLPGLGDRKYVYIFSAIGFFIMLIACINYINLSTARILERAREVGIRKAVGSNRGQLVSHFLVDSSLYVLLAGAIAVALVQWSLPEFNRLSGTTLARGFADANTWVGLIAAMCLACFCAGIYPSLRLSSLSPVAGWKDLSPAGRKGSMARKTLVVVQFSLSIILIVGTAILYQQLDYIRSKKLGFDRDNIIYFRAKGEFLQHYGVLKHELLGHSSIIDVTVEDRFLMNAANSTDRLDWEGKSGEAYVNVEYSFVDRNYFQMLAVAMKDGRPFSPEPGADGDAFILNEEAVRQMKIEAPVGKRFSLNSKRGVVVGVIQDVNFKSLRKRIEPTVYGLLTDYSGLSFTYNGTILVKTAAGKTDDAIAAIGMLWRNVNPDLPFVYHFLDESVDRQYLKEHQTGEIVGVFSVMAIVISCLGLYGLTSFVTESRTKEIGVRKVLGASVPEILILLSKESAKAVLVANVIAWPTAYLVMNSWLNDFAYRVNINAWVFVASGALALVIAMLTVSAHAWKAATANPIQSLRYE